MAHVDHDALVSAFIIVDPSCMSHTRGSDDPEDVAARYTHIHSATQAIGNQRCTTHLITISEYNGAVVLRQELAGPFGLRPRPAVHITKHPLGAGAGGAGHVGNFDHGETAADILIRWGSYEAFARDVVNACKARKLW